MRATLRLFKAVPIAAKGYDVIPDSEIMAETLKYGFIFDPQLFANYNTQELKKLIHLTAKELHLSGLQMNRSFHKSWEKVRTAPIMQLVMEQMIHYMTTYGFEALGIYDSNSVYIPAEALEVPEFKEGGFNVTVIRGLTLRDLREKLLTFLASGIALKQDTVEDVLDVAKFLGLTEEEVEGIKNREVKVAMYDHLGLIPGNPVEFLRFVVYKATGKTLLIKDRVTEATLRLRTNSTVTGLFSQYEQKHGLEKLAQIFFRFKPLFLALRKDEFLKRKVNRIRKLANKFHLPMGHDYFNTITAQVQAGTLDLNEFNERLGDLNIFRKVRLANTLAYRANKTSEAILYKIRNGRAYATTAKFKNPDLAQDALTVVMTSIGKDLAHLKGKVFYLPEEIVYGLPSSEKQFTGMFPNGSYVSVTGKNLLVGVYWENVGKVRVDLDLSMLTLGRKIGWDGVYRDDEVLFSGDVTSAPHGATEIHNIAGKQDGLYLLMLNYFNAGHNMTNGSGDEVPYKLFVGSEPIDRLKFASGSPNNPYIPYIVNPNNVLALTPAKVTAADKQRVLGLVESRKGEVRFYFGEFAIGNSMSAGFKPHNDQAKQYLADYQRSTVSLVDVLIAAGALFCEKDEIDENTIDLSPEKLEKDTFINLLTRKE